MRLGWGKRRGSLVWGVSLTLDTSRNIWNCQLAGECDVGIPSPKSWLFGGLVSAGVSLAG